MSVGIHTDISIASVTIAGASTSASTPSAGNAATSSSTVTATGGASAGAASAGTGAGDSSGSSDSSSASASPTVTALKREIAQLQKMLAQEQQQLHAASAGQRGKDPANLAEISALQSAVATTMGQLESAVSALSTALLAESGSTTGSLVSASA